MFTSSSRSVAAAVLVGCPMAAQAGPVVLGEQVAKLLASDTALEDAHFGKSAAVSGDTAVVGAGAFSASAILGPGAYVFVRSGTSWTEQAKLTPSDPAVGLGFAGSVAVAGDRAFATAPRHSYQGHFEAGSAFVFVRNGTIWTEEAMLLPADPSDGARMGSSIAVRGDTVIVGAVNEYGAADSAYVFERAGSSWSQQAKLVASDAAPWDEFGSSVAIFGDTAVVGAVHAKPGGMDAGAAYVFVRNGTTWSEQAKLIASDAAHGDFFGASASAWGDALVVGAWGATLPAGPQAGAAYVFERSGASWSETAKLTASNAADSARFGESVSLEDDLLVVGAPASAAAADETGSAYVFARDGAAWSEELELKGGGATEHAGLGAAVALSGDEVFAGAPRYEIYGGHPPTFGWHEVGAAYVFRLQECAGHLIASEVPRAGTPPNPARLLPGQTSGPAVGKTWDPLLDPSLSFGVLPVLVITGQPAEIVGPFGTILCDTSGGSFVFTSWIGLPFAVPIPADCAAVGATFCAQAAWVVPSIVLSNALDVTVGTP